MIGIVASRLVDLYHRPCILLDARPGQPARGSARSVDGINITEAIAAQKALLIGFGGHPMAAGLTVQPDQLPQFARSISRYIQHLDQKAANLQALSIDSVVPLRDLSISLVERISRLSPFGAGNPALILAAYNLSIRQKSPIGKKGEHLKLIVKDASGTSSQVIWWQGVGAPLPEDRFNLAYTVRASDFKGNPQVQVEWIGFQEIQQESIDLSETSSDIEFVDWRNRSITPIQMENLMAEKPAIWGEGDIPPNLPAQNRLNLKPNPVLIIWNAPPGIVELKQALEAVKPSKIVLLANMQTNDRLVEFITGLSALVRYCLHENEGRFEIQSAAAHLGHRNTTIRCGINWLCAKGYIKLGPSLVTGRFHLLTPGIPELGIEKSELDLKMALKETNAYRLFYLRARPELIISAAQKMTAEKS